jgi:hypothetical protein
MGARTSVAVAAQPDGGGTSDAVQANGAVGTGTGAVDAAGQPRLRHELRNNLAVAGFSLGLSVLVAVGLSLLMTLLG